MRTNTFGQIGVDFREVSTFVDNNFDTENVKGPANVFPFTSAVKALPGLHWDGEKRFDIYFHYTGFEYIPCMYSRDSSVPPLKLTIDDVFQWKYLRNPSLNRKYPKALDVITCDYTPEGVWSYFILMNLDNFLNFPKHDCRGNMAILQYEDVKTYIRICDEDMEDYISHPRWENNTFFTGKNCVKILDLLKSDKLYPKVELKRNNKVVITYYYFYNLRGLIRVQDSFAYKDGRLELFGKKSTTPVQNRCPYMI